METEALLLKGGKNGKLWDSTAENFGLMMKRIHLPEEQKEHMPPKGKPQLSNEEIKAIFYWIKDGASFTKKLIELPETDTLRMVATGFFKTIETDNYDFASADEAAIKKLNTDYRLVQPVALNSPALSVQFFGASFFKGEQIKELEKVKNNIVSLNLNKMPVKNEDLKRLTAFKNLRKLNLSFTQITGDGLSELKVLRELRHLSLAGTVIKAADIELLKGMDKLTAIYLWNTGITENEIASLRKKFPETTIQTGFRGDTVIARLNMPVIEGEEQIFTGEARIKVKNFIKGAVMRYTIDGSNPDSLQSPVYKDDIVMDKSGVLKVKAFLPGWISSDIAERNFYKTGFKPDSVKLATPPNPTYAADGGKTLSDGEKGELNFRTKWLGYKDNDMLAYLYFNEPVQLSNVSISTIIDIGSYIMPAQQIEVWGGTSFSSLQLLKKINPQQPSMQVPPYMKGFDCNFPKREIKILKIIAKPVNRLPSWHPGKGQRGWVFVDEVFLN
jgi:Chitobiase/beta-hexosaminidase C-terminal domain